MNENSELRVRLGFGALFALAFVATLHALTLSMSLQHRPMRDFEIVELPPLLNPNAASQSVYSSYPELPSVNKTAQSELKHAPYQPPNKSTRQQIGQIGPMNGSKSVQADCPSCPQPANPQPYYPAPRPPNTPAPTTGIKDYQLLVFIGNDDQSREILNWFNSHPKFQFLRSQNSKVAVQVYSPGDLLYRTRYASVVPPTEFPAVVLADSLGGHIHAASKQFIPRGDPDKFYDDLKLGTQLYMQAKQQRPAQARTSGAMTATRQYTWDEAVSPNMKLESTQPPIEEGLWKPLDNLKPGGLFDSLCGPDGCTPKNALVWTNASEIMMLGLVIVGIIAAVALVAKLVRK